MGNSKVLWGIIVILVGALIWSFFLRGDSSNIDPEGTLINTSSENTSSTQTNTSTSPIPTVTVPKVIPPVKVIVSGQFNYSEDINSPIYPAGRVCFSVDSATAGKIAKWSEAKKTPYFCFENKDEAFPLFNIEKGFSDGSKQCTVLAPATVEIKNYQLLTGDVGGYDSAILTKVISIGKKSFLGCIIGIL